MADRLGDRQPGSQGKERSKARRAALAPPPLRMRPRAWDTPPLAPPLPALLSLPAHPQPHSGVWLPLPAMALPDTEFYRRRIAKCRAVPESERGANARALLESHEMIEAALAVVPPQGTRRAAPSRDAVSVAQALWLRAYVECDAAPAHPMCSTDWLLDYLAPAVPYIGTHQAAVSIDWARVPFPPAGHEDTLQALGFLLRGIVGGARLIAPPRELHMLRTACLKVLDTAGDAAVDAALAQLAAAAGSSGPRLPTAAELRIACVTSIVEHTPEDKAIRATERLLQLLPDSPRALMKLAKLDSGAWEGRACAHSVPPLVQGRTRAAQ